MVNKRRIPNASLLCFGSAGILAMIAASEFFGIFNPLAISWVLLISAGLMGGAGVLALNSYSSLSDALNRANAEVDLSRTQLAQQRSAVDSLAEGLEIAFFICNPRAEILYANRRAIEFFKVESPIGRSILAITLSYNLEQLVLGASQERGGQRSELNFAYPVERVAVANAWLEEGGERIFLSLYEITDLRRLERIRQDFVSNVSHELRTPLTIIRSMAETLLDEDPIDQETAERFLPKITAEVDRLSLLSNDLLILSAAESNPVRKLRCDVAEVFRSALEHLAAKAKLKGIEASYVGPKHLVIEANGAQLTQVAINLIDNAISYTTEGSIEMTVESGDSQVSIKVRDTGQGIASEHLPRIFERFYRADKGRSRASGGTGLGLAIVKHIVESHGGTITANSVLDEGSEFIVRLPIGNPPGELG